MAAAPREPWAKAWNNVIVAILLFVFSLVPSALERQGGFVEA